MNKTNEGLLELWKFWRLEADCMYCQFCKRGITQARDGETFNHRAGCRNTQSQPWARLRDAMTPKASFKRVYLSGPMTGLPDFNFPAFNQEAARLRALGYDVVNPAELHTSNDLTWPDYMRVDLAVMVTCGTIALLPGYDNSRGASLELYVARALGLGAWMASDINKKVVNHE